jgi:hypothetical protein
MVLAVKLTSQTHELISSITVLDCSIFFLNSNPFNVVLYKTFEFSAISSTKPLFIKLIRYGYTVVESRNYFASGFALIPYYGI